jgi:hypothetical protein
MSRMTPELGSLVRSISALRHVGAQSAPDRPRAFTLNVAGVQPDVEYLMPVASGVRAPYAQALRSPIDARRDSAQRGLGLAMPRQFSM